MQEGVEIADLVEEQRALAPPTYSKSNPADTPILTLSISSDTIPRDQVDDYADSILAQKISQVSGVGLVTLNGGQKPAVRVQVDPTVIAGLGLGLEDGRAAVVASNVNQPKGNLDGARQSYMIAADDQLTKASAYRPLVIAYKNGAPVRLTDVATVSDGSPRSTGSPCICRRFRISRSTAAPAAPSSSTRSKTPTPPSSARLRRASSTS